MPIFDLPAVRACAADSPYAAVDVFIGTGGDGHCHPGATRPFGMVQLGPDTQHRHYRQSYLGQPATATRTTRSLVFRTLIFRGPDTATWGMSS